VLADGVKTAAFSYIGPEVTYPIYREGTIGRAKEHLEASARTITEQLSSLNGTAFVSVNKALVTRASAVIPVVPLYISLLYRIMKQKGIHEGCTEQMFRLLTERLYTGNTIETDSTGRIRIDDLEMREDVQQEVISLWDQVNTGNAEELTDLAGYRREYLQLHGFMVDGVDYEADADPREI
jgi:enoyl-[acyl-carrier protein] reductase/trans-2-enoyl-CoA reductase (NAD+)